MTQPLSPTCPLGMINEMIRKDHPEIANIIDRRTHDEEDYALLTRHILFGYAHHHGINLDDLIKISREIKK
jgi:hypothetical protein